MSVGEELALSRVQFSPVGATFPEGMTFDEWDAAGKTLERIEGAVNWWIGDWLNFGERKYGETYAQAMESTRLSYSTLTKFAYVAGRIEVFRRRKSLSWTHHAEVAPLAPEQQDELLDLAEGNKLSKRDVRRLVKAPQVGENVPLPDGQYATIVADPPWQYGNTATRGAAEDHYGTMTIDELCEIPVAARSAEASHLYLWTTNGFLREAFTVMEAWGFVYKTTLTWVKPQIGLGNYFRNSTEHVLFGIRGGLGTNAKDQRTSFEAPRGRHSAKPGLFYDIVEKASPGPYLEMFARSQRFGWDSWGNEALEHVEMTA